MPGLRWHLFQLTDHSATVVDFNLFIPGLTVENLFVIALNAQLANVVRRRIVGEFAVFVQPVDVFIVDFRDIADDMRQGRAVRVEAALVAFDLYAGKTVLVHGETGYLHLGEVGFYRYRREAMRAGALFFEGGNIVVIQIDYAAQRFERLLHVIDLLWHHFNLIDRAVQRQWRTVAIVDNAAAWGDRDEFNAVFVGAGLVIGKTDNLQIIEVGDQHASQQQNPQKGDDCPAHKQRGLSRIVAKRIL